MAFTPGTTIGVLLPHNFPRGFKTTLPAQKERLSMDLLLMDQASSRSLELMSRTLDHQPHFAFRQQTHSEEECCRCCICNSRSFIFQLQMIRLSCTTYSPLFSLPIEISLDTFSYFFSQTFPYFYRRLSSHSYCINHYLFTLLSTLRMNRNED